MEKDSGIRMARHHQKQSFDREPDYLMVPKKESSGHVSTNSMISFSPASRQSPRVDRGTVEQFSFGILRKEEKTQTVKPPMDKPPSMSPSMSPPQQPIADEKLKIPPKPVALRKTLSLGPPQTPKSQPPTFFASSKLGGGESAIIRKTTEPGPSLLKTDTLQSLNLQTPPSQVSPDPCSSPISSASSAMRDSLKSPADRPSVTVGSLLSFAPVPIEKVRIPASANEEASPRRQPPDMTSDIQQLLIHLEKKAPDFYTKSVEAQRLKLSLEQRQLQIEEQLELQKAEDSARRESKNMSLMVEHLSHSVHEKLGRIEQLENALKEKQKTIDAQNAQLVSLLEEKQGLDEDFQLQYQHNELFKAQIKDQLSQTKKENLVYKEAIQGIRRVSQNVTDVVQKQISEVIEKVDSPTIGKDEQVEFNYEKEKSPSQSDDGGPRFDFLLTPNLKESSKIEEMFLKEAAQFEDVRNSSQPKLGAFESFGKKTTNSGKSNSPQFFSPSSSSCERTLEQKISERKASLFKVSSHGDREKRQSGRFGFRQVTDEDKKSSSSLTEDDNLAYSPDDGRSGEEAGEESEEKRLKKVVMKKISSLNMAMQLMARNLKDMQSSPDEVDPQKQLTLSKIRSTDVNQRLGPKSQTDQLGCSPPRILRQKTLFDKNYRNRVDSFKAELVSEDDRSTFMIPQHENDIFKSEFQFLDQLAELQQQQQLMFKGQSSESRNHEGVGDIQSTSKIEFLASTASFIERQKRDLEKLAEESTTQKNRETLKKKLNFSQSLLIQFLPKITESPDDNEKASKSPKERVSKKIYMVESLSEGTQNLEQLNFNRYLEERSSKSSRKEPRFDVSGFNPISKLVSEYTQINERFITVDSGSNKSSVSKYLPSDISPKNSGAAAIEEEKEGSKISKLKFLESATPDEPLRITSRKSSELTQTPEQLREESSPPRLSPPFKSKKNFMDKEYFKRLLLSFQMQRAEPLAVDGEMLYFEATLVRHLPFFKYHSFIQQVFDNHDSKTSKKADTPRSLKCEGSLSDFFSQFADRQQTEVALAVPQRKLKLSRSVKNPASSEKLTIAEKNQAAALKQRQAVRRRFSPHTLEQVKQRCSVAKTSRAATSFMERGEGGGLSSFVNSPARQRPAYMRY